MWVRRRPAARPRRKHTSSSRNEQRESGENQRPTGNGIHVPFASEPTQHRVQQRRHSHHYGNHRQKHVHRPRKPHSEIYTDTDSKYLGREPVSKLTGLEKIALSLFGRKQRGNMSKTPNKGTASCGSRRRKTYVEVEEDTTHRARPTARPKTNESEDTWTTTSRRTSTTQPTNREAARKQRTRRAAMPSTNSKKQSSQRPKITDETKVGEGSFGEVWRAKHSVYGTVAIKRVVVLNKEIKEMAEKELQLSREVSGHINIIKFHDGFSRTIDSVLNVVLIFQFAPGGDLERRIKERTLYESDRIIVIKGSLSGLRHMHSLKRVHGDIKPANILFMGHKNEGVIESDVKLSDFGLTSRISQGRYCRLGGAVSYVSPEAWDCNLTYALDVWALGVTLYEMYNGLDSFPVIRPEKHDRRQPARIAREILSYKRVWDKPSWYNNGHVLSLCQGMLDTSYISRITVEKALKHPCLNV